MKVIINNDKFNITLNLFNITLNHHAHSDR